MVQRLHFAKELRALSSQNAVCRGSPLFKLDVFLEEDGLIRVGGRIRQSSLSDDVNHPVVLPSNHGLSRLIIQNFHQNTHHQGRGITCSEVRSHGFWILSLQRRFVALRGSVIEIRCDQGTNLVGARNDLMKMGCDMVFNPPSSSHRGGVWERMIGVARRIIEGILIMKTHPPGEETQTPPEKEKLAHGESPTDQRTSPQFQLNYDIQLRRLQMEREIARQKLEMEERRAQQMMEKELDLRFREVKLKEEQRNRGRPNCREYFGGGDNES
ncbi:hypothetical protein Pcinc_000653 [Petrolisthes cinctipes]|uniref:Uncharacterized protein n=1 Tax=Petrolisthes cinctipes TaxID=88211 RepID=A0AAE1GPF4_PETCI|nr:hypothetical protein Pcinc_000653 [Petrolisthes cinctipes]